MTQERLQDGRARSLPACVRRGRHAPHPPRARLAVSGDEADRDQRVAIERADREPVGGLVRGELGDGFVWAQNRLAQHARLLERYLAYIHVCHLGATLTSGS